MDLRKSVTAALWFRSLGIFLLGVMGAFTAGTTFVMVREEHSSNRETECVRELNNDANSLQGEINTVGWTTLLERVGGASGEEVQQNVDDMKELVQRWRVADGRRQRVAELC